MATPPDFVAGSILTAAQMNAIGMWEIKSDTIGTAVASATVTSVFTTDYQTYKIVVSGVSFSTAGTAVYLKLNNSTGSTYYGNMIYNVPTSGSLAGVSAINGSNLGFFVTTSSSSGLNDFEVTIGNPFTATTSNCFGTYAGRSYNGSVGTHDSNAASSTGFILAPGAGTMTGGTIRIYGYRN
jgi:hypothetical protein